MRRVAIRDDFDAWRDAARALLSERVEPSAVLWDDGASTFLPFGEDAPPPELSSPMRLPKRFVDVARRVAAHRDGDRWALLYRVAFRLRYENAGLLEILIDDDVHRLFTLDHDIRRDVHKMHAFVRFHDVDGTFVAWYRPDHRILQLAAPFFVDRFRSQEWSILTPDESAYWDGQKLSFGKGVSRESAPTSDDLETLWRTYYASIFNPARTNLKKMATEMPGRFWARLPELRDVPKLVASANTRVGSMIESARHAPTALPFLPAARDLPALRAAAASCQGCPLHERATQTVFGSGPVAARIVLVGEQPGDAEDRQGLPFVGPAGEVLQRAMEAAGLDRSEAYVTNAVKHFAWIERGQRRIHRTPKQIEVTACRPWLEAEVAAIDPTIIVALGATAARALVGSTFRLMQERGRLIRTRAGRPLVATIHPSAVLRVDVSLRDEYATMLARDLELAAVYASRATKETEQTLYA